MKVEGKVKVIEGVIEVGNNGFKKRLLVVETTEQYSQQIGIDFVQDKTSLLDSFNVGDSVSVSINIRGNEYNGKYYVNLQGWRIEKADGVSPGSSFETTSAPATVSNEPDDLPF